MNDDSIFKNSLGQIGGLGKQLGKSVLDESKKTTKAVSAQVGLEHTERETSQNSEKGDNLKEISGVKDHSNKEIVNALYAPSEKNSSIKQENVKVQKAQEIAEENADKTPEEVQKIAALKQQLHRETYFDPTFNSKKAAQEEQVEEQKEEDEEVKKRWELQEKKEKEKEEAAVLQQKQKSVEKRPGAG